MPSHTTHRPAPYVCLIVLLMVSLLPTAAAAQEQLGVAPAGTAGADQQGTASFDGTGPVIVGPEYIEPVGFDGGDRQDRLIADSEGHLLAQGFTDAGVEQLVALNTDDGSVAWAADNIESDCQPVATDDGRIFAQLVSLTEAVGTDQNFSADPVELDAATGEIVNRYTSPDSEEFPRIGPCYDGLRLGADACWLRSRVRVSRSRWSASTPPSSRWKSSGGSTMPRRMTATASMPQPSTEL